MSIPQEVKRKVCEGLLHMEPKKRLAREYKISYGAIRDWSIFIDNGFFDWVDSPYVGQRKGLLEPAFEHWFENYPIGYTDAARRFGIRPASLYQFIRSRLDKLPATLRPKRMRFWDAKPTKFSGTLRMVIEKLSDISANRPLTTAERKALFAEIQEAKGRLICSEAMLEVAVESCKDELKKKN